MKVQVGEFSRCIIYFVEVNNYLKYCRELYSPLNDTPTDRENCLILIDCLVNCGNANEYNWYSKCQTNIYPHTSHHSLLIATISLT